MVRLSCASNLPEVVCAKCAAPVEMMILSGIVSIGLQLAPDDTEISIGRKHRQQFDDETSEREKRCEIQQI